MLERPFHLITVFWGERFRRYFLDYLVASLLAPGNLPMLNSQGLCKFLIATYPEDWQAMQDDPRFLALWHYIEPTFLQIPPCPIGVHGCTHMGVGHKIACEIAHKEQAFAAILAPDSIISDGAIAALMRHAENGKKLVWAPACLRLAEEPFLRELTAMAVIGHRGLVIVASGAQLAEASIRSLHSAARPFEWDAPYVPTNRGQPCVFWRVSGNDGFLIYCLSWAPLLIDYAAVPIHDTSCLETWTSDGDYCFKNLGEIDALHIVRDSDELVYAGFTPEREQPVDLAGCFRDIPRNDIDAMKTEGIAQNFNSGLFDPLKQRAFLEPVLWHGHELDDRWPALASRARAIIEMALAT